MIFSELAKWFYKLEATASRNQMTEILAELFKTASPDEIGKICYLLQGRVVPLYENREFGVADKFMIRAIAQAYGVEEKLVNTEFKKLGDLGSAAEACYYVSKHGNRENLTVGAVYQSLYQLTKLSGVGSQEKKITALAEILKNADALSARFIARIPLDKLRLGFSDMTILDALSWLLVGDKSLRDKLEDAYNIRPDIGYIAGAVKEHGIKGLDHVSIKLGTPILASLCQRLPTADEMIKKMGEVGVEPKYDGERCQIHFQKLAQESSVQAFSRNLENITGTFPELTLIGKQLAANSVVLDSEAIGVDPKTGKFIPFQQTMTRKRKHAVAAAQASVPVKFYVFDVLYKDGKDLLSTPLSDRRKILESTVKLGEHLIISPQIVTGSADKIRKYHDTQIKKGLEGAVVKRWVSPYEPGRRGYSWVKFKEEEGKTGKLTDTIDAVVMGYTKGEGKRSVFGIGQFLVGVRKGEEFVTLTKIGTGVSDEQWQELKRSLTKLSVAKQPKEYTEVAKMLAPDVWVRPAMVVELAGDDLTISPNHGAGYAVRFPRLVRVRHDKRPAEATTVAEITRMYKNQLSLGRKS